MNNEVLFFGIALLDLAVVTACFRLGKEWLFASLVVNLILVSILGAKIVALFGFVSNAGNVFYATVFFATHLITEHYGKKEGYKTIGIGLMAVTLCIVLSQLTLRFTSLPDSGDINVAMQTLLRSTPRIAVASMVAYFFAQMINITMYSYIKTLTGQPFLWLRDSLANVVGQFVDSLLFFSIAFWGVLPAELLWQSIFAGYLIKVVVGFCGLPWLYASAFIKKEYEHTN